MKNDYLNMLASLVLPAQILDYFLISGVEQTAQFENLGELVKNTIFVA